MIRVCMKGRIVNFRRGKETTYHNQMIIEAGQSNREEATKLVGKEVVYDTGKNKIKGEVRSAHGNSGALRVMFEKGMPGQSLGKEVELK